MSGGSSPSEGLAAPGSRLRAPGSEGEEQRVVRSAEKCLPSQAVWVLLNSKTSRPNKLALAADYRSRGFFLCWEWMGRPMRSRLGFRFSPTDRLFVASSYEEDVAPLLEERQGGKS